MKLTIRLAHNLFIVASVLIVVSSSINCQEIEGNLVLESIDNGFLSCLRQSGGIQDEVNLPIKQNLHDSIRAKVINKINDGKFPLPSEGSITAENLEKIYYSVLCTTVFELDGKLNLNLSFKNETDIEFLSDLVVSQYEYRVNIALFLESILPSIEEKQIISAQVLELKNRLLNIITSKFPDAPEDSVKETIDRHFIRYEQGPSSVMNFTAKRKLEPNQIENIIKYWNEQSAEIQSLEERMSTLLDEKSREDKGIRSRMRVKIRLVLTRMIRYYTHFLSNEFEANFPSDLDMPKKTEDLIDLEERFRNAIDANK